MEKVNFRPMQTLQGERDNLPHPEQLSGVPAKWKVFLAPQQCGQLCYQVRLDMIVLSLLLKLAAVDTFPLEITQPCTHSISLLKLVLSWPSLSRTSWHFLSSDYEYL